jgi:hypothetical protein
MPTLDIEIRARTGTFAADLAALVRKLALESVQAALGGDAPAVTQAGAAPSRTATKPRGARKTAPRAVPARTTSKLTPRKRASGAKRLPGDIQKLSDKLAAYIAAHPGVGMETIRAALAVPRKELALPAKKLVDARKIRSEGEKRSTRYFPT